MKTILIFVSSLDGKITRWGDPKVREWSSESDQNYFDEIWNHNRVIIMGSTTWLAEPVMPDSKHLYIVMTGRPEAFSKNELPGQLEFTEASPSQLISRFKDEGVEHLLIVGGPKVATSFLMEELIDELWLTIEPKIFGVGGGFVINEKMDVRLKLLSVSKANEQGTLFTKYKVVRNQERMRR